VADTLLVDIQTVLREAQAAAPTPELHAALGDAQRRLDEPLRVAIAGRVKAGKSTLLNALVGEELAPTDRRECTTIVTWYRNAPTYRVIRHLKAGQAVECAFTRDDGAIDVDLGGTTADAVDHLEVQWPSARLELMTLIDTPGIGSISADVSARTFEFLVTEDERPTTADAVLYLLRHLHVNDVHFLDAFHDDELGYGTPINAIGVLSRADEVGSCRPGAMEAAAGVAARYERDPKVRKLCRVIVPIAGLLAQAGATLREEEFRAIARLVEVPGEELTELLLTADRFARNESFTALSTDVRLRLLQRLGLYGLRLSVDLVRTRRAPDAPSLAAALVEASGVPRLQGLLFTQFAERSRALKARSALATLDAVLRQPGWADPDRFRSRSEQIAAGAHEIVEIRLLNSLRGNEIDLPVDQADEADRLLGGSGASTPARLGVGPQTPVAELQRLLVDALQRWKLIAEHPLSSTAAKQAARGVVRSCEGALVQVTTPALPY
jgi:hypothetical protein